LRIINFAKLTTEIFSVLNKKEAKIPFRRKILTMATKNTSTIPNIFDADLKVAKELVYDVCDLELSDLKQNLESAEYAACSFKLNGKTIQYRVSKITPTKTGQFVTIWKRNKDGITASFDVSDDLDLIIITSKSGANIGQFIFPKTVLAEKGIITRNGKQGKRGIRVYPPWDIATNKQAKQTQSWQTKYFLPITGVNSGDKELIKKLLAESL